MKPQMIVTLSLHIHYTNHHSQPSAHQPTLLSLPLVSSPTLPLIVKQLGLGLINLLHNS